MKTTKSRLFIKSVTTLLALTSPTPSSSFHPLSRRLGAVSFPRFRSPTPTFYSLTTHLSMVRGVKKEHLPSKVCIVCNRPFTWRKKWENCWDEVSTCSKSCNHQRRREKQQKKKQADSARVVSSLAREESMLPRHLSAVSVEVDHAEDRLPSNSQNNAIEHVAGLSHAPLSAEDQLLLLEQRNSDHDGNVVSANTRASSIFSFDTTTDTELDTKAARKAAKKQMKAMKRQQRQGLLPSQGQKTCTVCGKSVDLLVRCTIDQSGEWNMVCGPCWPSVSGGVVDGDPRTHPHYRYGGLWKNRRRRRRMG